MESNGTKIFFGMVQVRLSQKCATLTFSFFLQGISQLVNPTRIMGYSREGMPCKPNTIFTDDSFEVTLPVDAGFGENVTMCVQLTFGNCMEMASRDFTSKSAILTQSLTDAHVVFPP